MIQLKKNRWTKVGILAMMSVCIGVFSGCGGGGWFRDRSHDYNQAESCSNIGLPSGVQAEGVSDEYSIPGE